MTDNDSCLLTARTRAPWNKGKLTGAKPPLRPKHVWAIRTRLMIQGRTRDLAMFNVAIDSKLRGCDVVALTVEDVAPNGYAIDRAMVRQKKTGRPVKFELTDQTRQAVDDYLQASGKKSGEFLFTSRRRTDSCMTTRGKSRCSWDTATYCWSAVGWTVDEVGYLNKLNAAQRYTRRKPQNPRPRCRPC